MADIAAKRAHAWRNALSHYEALEQELERSEPAQAPPLQLALTEALDELMDLPAPSFIAVKQKLLWLWEADVEKPDRDGAEKLQILEDLSDLIDEAAATLGFGRTLSNLI